MLNIEPPVISSESFEEEDFPILGDGWVTCWVGNV